MATYVSDWTQEVYGDVRSYAVPGVPTSDRRDYLNDYLQHKLVLAGARPADDRDGALVPADDLQPARERGVGAGHGLRLDDGLAGADGGVRLGAGPRASLLQRDDRAGARSLGLRVGAEERDGHVRRRLRGADEPRPRSARRRRARLRRRRPIRPIREAPRAGRRVRTSGASATSRAPTPGRGVEVVPGLDAVGARVRARRRRRSPPGRRRRAMSLTLVTSSGLPVTTPTPLAVTLSSSSPQGEFSTSPAGPWTTDAVAHDRRRHGNAAPSSTTATRVRAATC